MNLQFLFGILTTIAFLYAECDQEWNFCHSIMNVNEKFFSALFAFNSFDEIFSSISASNITFVMLIELYNELYYTLYSDYTLFSILLLFDITRLILNFYSNWKKLMMRNASFWSLPNEDFLKAHQLFDVTDMASSC